MAKSNTDNDNIFAAGSGEPESKPATGDGGNASTDKLPPGRIDPAIARASSGAGSTAREPDSGTSGSTADLGTGTGRGRGRPRNDGKPPGSPVEKAPPRSVRASFFEKTLFSIHLGLASVASAPEFKLEKDDAKELGEAIAGVMKFYGVTMTPKQEAYALLMEAAAKVYPPMIVSYVVRKQIEAKKGQSSNRTGNAAPPPSPRTAAPPPPPPGNVNGQHKPNEQAAAPTAASQAAPSGSSLLPPGFDPFNIRVEDGSWNKKN